MVNTTIARYANAIITGDKSSLETVLDNAVLLKTPGAKEAITDKNKIATMLGTASAIITNFKVGRTLEGNENWFMVLLEGYIDGLAVQIIDHIHIGETGSIDTIDLFLRPANMADKVLEKIITAIQNHHSL